MSVAVPAAIVPSCAVSVVVVMYNMRREAQRTLRSLARSYQRGLDEVDYEVIVVDNGSAPDQRLDDATVTGFGAEFRLIEMGDDATSSPTKALNAGIAATRGEFVACMIDGAHVLSPGVLRHALDALRLYAPAIVATQGFFLGPGHQGETMLAGYDQSAEDRLMEAIDWPNDGYRLFDIAHFQENRDWFDGMWESNCLFAPRALLEQVGGFDDDFDEPGGGYANLEIFERLGGHPGVTVASMLGEGSFHQIHGGTTNNEPSPEQRFALLESYRDRYAELRGRPWDGPRKPIHFVGSMHPGARRTKARRMRPERRYFGAASVKTPPVGRLPKTPLPDDLRDAHLESYWLSRAWEATEWAGHRVPTTPDDLLVAGRLVQQTRPDWVVDVGDGQLGRSLFLADTCASIDHGRVLAVTPEPVDLPSHGRLDAATMADIVDDAAWAGVAERVGEGCALVIIGGPRRRRDLMVAFEHLRPLVAVGSYVVLEWTVVNGNPIWPEHGAGAREAVRDLREPFPDFVVDQTVDPTGPSFNRGGYLKRVR
ncbi:MAG: CmcI family methyltransferase [Actinomycetota bacterium]